MSNQQRAYLKAMGIDVWVERTTPAPEVAPLDVEQIAAITAEAQIEAQPVIAAPPVADEITENITDTQTKQAGIDSLDWQALQAVVSECQHCALAENRTKTLFGTGKQTASLMVLGDAPNAEDEHHGQAFAGEAGKLLTAMLKAMGYQRNEVYISNLVKCRTADNQDPSADEVAACEAYLLRQINLLQPDVILALGSITAQRLLKSKSTLNRLRGQLHYIDGVNAPVIVSFDPAYLIRSPNEKRKAWQDLQMAIKALATMNGVNG